MRTVYVTVVVTYESHTTGRLHVNQTTTTSNCSRQDAQIESKLSTNRRDSIKSVRNLLEPSQNGSQTAHNRTSTISNLDQADLPAFKDPLSNVRLRKLTREIHA